MNLFNRISNGIKPRTINYGHIQKNKKNIETLKRAKKEIEENLRKKRHVKEIVIDDDYSAWKRKKCNIFPVAKWWGWGASEDEIKSLEKFPWCLVAL